MEKSEKLILKAFMEMKVLKDFESGLQNTLLVDSIQGLVSRSYSGESINKQELDLYNLDTDAKQRISCFVSRSSDNLIFYNLMKSCLLIMYHYSNNN